jgi:hypothetical protein
MKPNERLFPTRYKMEIRNNGKAGYTMELTKTVNFTEYRVKTFTCRTSKEVDAICEKIEKTVERIMKP